MNSYLFNRALGSISPSSFHVDQTTRLVHLLEPAPGIRFSSVKDLASAKGTETEFDSTDEVLAHHAGVNAVAIDQYEGRLYVTHGHD